MFMKAVRSKNCNPTEEFLKMDAFLYSKNAQMNEEDARINEEEHDIEDGELLEEIWFMLKISLLICLNALVSFNFEFSNNE